VVKNTDWRRHERAAASPERQQGKVSPAPKP
jgi:hypothetical protein